MSDLTVDLRRLSHGYVVVCSEHGEIGYRRQPKTASQLAGRHYDAEHATNDA